MQSLSRYHTLLEQLEARGRRRSLRVPAGVDFTSNDYLGLASSPRLGRAMCDALARGLPVGAGASRLLRGNHLEIEALEGQAAKFFGAERALLFGSGYAANTALFSTLPQPGDLIVHDALIHASVRDGIRLGRASAVAFPHNDVTA